MKKKLLSIILGAAGLFVMVGNVQAAPTFSEFSIVQEGGDPAIYDNKIVWNDYRNGNFDIYMYDLTTSTETQITTNSSDQIEPAIYGDKIVWIDYRNGNLDIYMYDIATSAETQITTDISSQYSPIIYDDKIVWLDSRNGNFDIYMYDIATSTETQITTNSSDQTGPAIYGDKIVWRDDRNVNADIYMYDLTTSTETQITTDSSYQYWPAIYDDKIVWQDDRNGNSDIYMYDLTTSTETQITTDSSDQYYPAIYGNNIFWIDYRNVNPDIYMYDLTTSTETQITNDGSDVYRPVIYGDKIVRQEVGGGILLDTFDKYWVGNGGDWTDTTHWSYESGGSVGAPTPDAYTEIIFDENSITAEGQTITFPANQTSYMYNWDMADLAYPITMDSTNGEDYWELSVADGTVNVYDTTLVNSHAIGGADFYALTSNGNIDGGGNEGWMFEEEEEEEEEVKEFKITDDDFRQVNPDIYGDRIVWQDDRNGNSDIYMYDLTTSTETQITVDESNQGRPAIYDDKIVWHDFRNGNYDIYMYDLSTSTETQITTDPNDQKMGDIYGNIIVWQDDRNDPGGYYDIYIYDLTTSMEIQVTDNEMCQSHPVIYGDRIVWQDTRDYGYSRASIYMYDISTSIETPITTDNSGQIKPAIYEDKIVWHDNNYNTDNQNADVYLYDLSTSTKTLVTPYDSSCQAQPDIYGDRIVWHDNRGYYNKIYVYEISTATEFRIDVGTESDSQSKPAIYGDRIVWQNNCENIYLATFDKYWVGNGGDWTDTNHWSYESGGEGGAPVPDAYTQVIFDENSITAEDQTITFPIDQTSYMYNWDMADLSYPITMDSTNGEDYWELSVAEGEVNAYDTTLINSHATGGATFYALTSNGNTDGGGNEGWDFGDEEEEEEGEEATTTGITLFDITDITKDSVKLKLQLDQDYADQSLDFEVEIKNKDDDDEKHHDHFTKTVDSEGKVSLTIDDLDSHTDYEFKVKFSLPDADDYSAYSNTKSATTDYDIEGDECVPTDLSASVSSGVVSLTWEDNCKCENSYLIERKTEGGSFQVIDQLDKNTEEYQDDNVSSGHTYTYRVRAQQGDRYSEYSNKAEAVLPAAVLSPDENPLTEDPSTEETSITEEEATDKEMSPTSSPIQEISSKKDPKPIFSPKTIDQVAPVLALVGFLSGLTLVTASSSIPLFSTSPLPFSQQLPGKFFTLFGFIGRSAARRRTMGTVFDKETRRPIEGAKVSIISQEGKIVDTVTTDSQGRYGFLARDGQYRLKVSKPGYLPDQEEAQDELYGQLYTGQPITINQDQMIQTSLAMKAVNVDWNQFARRKIAAYTSVFSIIKRDFFIILFYFGFFLSLVNLFFFDYSTWDIVIVIAYVVIVAYQLFLKPKKFGVITNRSGKPVPFSVISLYDQDDPTQRTAFAISDVLGRYFILAKEGHYLMKVQGRELSGRSFDLSGKVYAKHGMVKQDVRV